MDRAELKSPQALEVRYGIDTVAVYPQYASGAKKNIVVGPFKRTPENIRYCNAIADCANKELTGNYGGYKAAA